MMRTILRQLLRPDDVVDGCRHTSGLADFGDIPFREGLQVFLQACSDEANLSLFGLLGTRWDTRRLLNNLLRLRYEELRTPEILQQPIDRPLFITGMPRSGTTFLQSLLMADKTNRAPRVWQAIHPYPPLGLGRRPDRRRQQVARQLRMFGILSPGFRSMHPIDADSPQECSEIAAHVFASPRFEATYSIPSYQSWLAEVGHLDGYRFHKRFLQHLQHQEGSAVRWVLKCPDHVHTLDALRAVYPDARIVFVHRDPVQVLLSVTRLTEVLRKPFTRHIDRMAIGRHDHEYWHAAALAMMQAADEEPFAEPIFHIRHEDLVDDPTGTVEALYRHFGLALSDETKSHITGILEEVPDGGYGRNQFDPDTYGIDFASVRSDFAAYTNKFGIALSPAQRMEKPAAGLSSFSLRRG
jgi:Sulfotransferase family